MWGGEKRGIKTEKKKSEPGRVPASGWPLSLPSPAATRKKKKDLWEADRKKKRGRGAGATSFCFFNLPYVGDAKERRGGGKQRGKKKGERQLRSGSLYSHLFLNGGMVRKKKKEGKKKKRVL